MVGIGGDCAQRVVVHAHVQTDIRLVTPEMTIHAGVWAKRFALHGTIRVKFSFLAVALESVEIGEEGIRLTALT